ncbi:hypothetical protein EJ05DRAFT_514992 [Pseudovirgaria hyperparasitica]|uniref:C2H2-type domain-containing protein n=1 Tax=Pseudovirgaria hyperparasitica TaxID=470096 RepID=A0A6A6VTQ5_9PEZI|nr:uncharacterized protein EJ05DRAFT_514992 [Pseudovirgaria hyperparasitica]KAF2753535.1 hypothetical protein EJ05DRAFT_514992 [Pseudovirgaria hyperparasitica]
MPDQQHSIVNLLAAAHHTRPSTSQTALHISDRSRLSIQPLSAELLSQASHHHHHHHPSSQTLPPLIHSNRRLPSPNPIASTANITSITTTTTMHRSDTPPSMAQDIAYTRTGRISKAKKGLKVHHCKCGRSYTRAEHLRRHQKNHEEEPLRCDFPECGKSFHRPDLLQRHKERHSEMRRDSSTMDSRIPSSAAMHGSSIHSEYPVDTRVMHHSIYPASTASGILDLS